jgi:hypothetical protein
LRIVRQNLKKQEQEIKVKVEKTTYPSGGSNGFCGGLPLPSTTSSGTLRLHRINDLPSPSSSVPNPSVTGKWSEMV